MRSKQLFQARKDAEYLRKQKLLDTINNIVCILIKILLILWIIGIITISIHYIFTNNWDIFIRAFSSISTVGAGYFLRYLQEKGIRS